MDADELLDFIEHRMRMSHIYQPLLIRSLLDAGGLATLRQLAVEFARSDEAQIRYYQDRITKMPVPVLARHGVLNRDGDLVSLTLDDMSFEEQARLRAACEQRIGRFLAERGLSTWDYSLLETDPVPHSVRYQVLARDRICQLCGATRDHERLEVDHIVPRSRGGSNDPDNLQVLCAPCNRAKGNRDDTDFR
jgi:ATP adenylyltransferase